MKATKEEIKQVLLLRRLAGLATERYGPYIDLHATWKELQNPNRAAYLAVVRFINKNNFKWPDGNS